MLTQVASIKQGVTASKQLVGRRLRALLTGRNQGNKVSLIVRETDCSIQTGKTLSTKGLEGSQILAIVAQQNSG
jgi:hypothetical protein